MRHQIASVCACWAACLGLGAPFCALAQFDAKSSKITANDIIVATLQPTAAVTQPLVTIGAVAVIQGGEPWLRQRIAELDIAEVQRGGEPVIVTRDQVVLRIQLAGIDPAKFKIEGPVQTTIALKALQVTEQAIVRAAQEAILQKFKVDGKDLEFRMLEDVQLPVIEIAPGDQLRYSVDTPPGAISTGKIRIDIGVILNGQRRATVTLIVEAQLFRQVIVVTRRLEAGEALQPDSARVERRAVGPNDKWLTYSEQIFGNHAARTIAPGMTLTAADLDMQSGDDEMLIQARDAVKLVAAIGSLRIIATGEALQDGRLGQMIRVRNTESNRIVSGRVMGRGTVEVDY